VHLLWQRARSVPRSIADAAFWFGSGGFTARRGTSTLAMIALVVGGLALVVAIIAVVAGSGRRSLA